MAREIRNAIAYPFYDDLDFQNCHPSLLLQLCQRHEIRPVNPVNPANPVNLRVPPVNLRVPPANLRHPPSMA
jgi:hypothetical protein